MGAGLVARPLVHYLSEKGFRVIVGSRTLEKIEELIAGAKYAEARKLDVDSDADMIGVEEAVKESDAVVSMLPYLLHAKVAAVALNHSKHFLTTSYVSDAMRALEPLAKQKGVVMVNECGVDPGTDHMSAMRVFDQVHSRGGKIVSFLSYCGGLPAPDAKPNPLGYKFSWAPRGVLLASRNNALFLKDGKEVTIQGKDLFASFTLDSVEGAGDFECYPNRNSIQYLDIYPLKGECKTIIRGTYRNKGWCDAVKALADIDYLNTDPKPSLAGISYAALTRSLVGAKEGDDLISLVKSKMSLTSSEKRDRAIEVMKWLGLFDEKSKVAAKSVASQQTPLDALCDAMLERMQYEEGERDLLVMKHTFIAEFEKDRKREIYTSRLIDLGIKGGDSSMSRTVSLPVAIVTRLVLEGKYKHLSGLQLPLAREFYEPILNELDELGIHFMEKLEKTESF
jgi:saccharopine dehydrogenase-like NADP-dependent oxidoreductase